MLTGKTKQCKETKQTSETDSDMTQILKLLDREFKITVINMLRALMEKVDNTQEQMGNVNRHKNSKNQKKMLEIQNAVTEMKNALKCSSVDWTWLRKESVSLKIRQQKLPKLKCKEKKELKKKKEQNIQKLGDDFERCKIHTQLKHQKKQE